MKIFTSVKELRAELETAEQSGIGFVPTMGALHAGHRSLVERARRENATVVVSVFVNPTQFNDKNDLRHYPRTPEADARLLERAGADFVLMPSVEEIYPEPDGRQFDFGQIDKVMAGATRPGHFNGVAQVVSRLFDIVRPARAYFGEKDFQQIAVVKAMVDQLSLPVEIVECEIVRGEDGLALSSRNALLDAEHRAAAPQIYAALRAAAESGAKLVVCRGDTMGAALYRVQENYPDVHYLLFDSEPHSDDYSAYNTASLVHCVLFQEEQAGYLAGYAAVTDGYTTLGFIGAREIPGIVRYCTGFLQGAEAAAELQGEYVTLQTWFTDTYENNDAITQRMIDWYNNGTSLIMVSGGNLYEGVSGAVNQTGGKAITTDYDNTELGDRVLGSAIKCYNAAVQRQLYTFFAAGTWNGQTGGQTEKAGFTNGEVALVAGTPWRFDGFTQDDYRTLYEELRTSVLKVDAYSDLDTLPDTPNVTVNRLP